AMIPRPNAPPQTRTTKMISSTMRASKRRQNPAFSWMMSKSGRSFQTTSFACGDAYGLKSSGNADGFMNGSQCRLMQGRRTEPRRRESQTAQLRSASSDYRRIHCSIKQAGAVPCRYGDERGGRRYRFARRRRDSDTIRTASRPNARLTEGEKGHERGRRPRKRVPLPWGGPGLRARGLRSHHEVAIARETSLPLPTPC